MGGSPTPPYNNLWGGPNKGGRAYMYGDGYTKKIMPESCLLQGPTSQQIFIALLISEREH